MKKYKKNIVKAAVVLTLSVLFIASSSIAISAKSPEKPGFSYVKTSKILGNSGRVEEEIRYYNPDTLTHVIGVGNATMPFKWQSAIRLTQDELAAYANWNLTKVNVGYSADNGQLECDATVIIYGKGTATHPGAILSNDTTYHFDASGVFTIPLATPIKLGSYDELWVAVEWVQTEATAYLAVMDDGPAVDGKGDWGFDGNWSELQIYGLDYNWAIGAIVEGQGNAEISILNIKGPLGIKAEIKNIGVVPADNLEWSILVTGGILKRVNKTSTGSVTEVAVNASEAISMNIFFGLGQIQIEIKAHADNVVGVIVITSAVLLGPIVVGIK
jgi:hypothetical protein